MVSTTLTGSFKLLDAKTQWDAWYLTLQGESDFDQYVFNKLETGQLTSTQADYLWQYTDGYKIVLESRAILASASSIHCLKKSYSIITKAAYDTGSVCFETSFGVLNRLSYYGGVDLNVGALVVANNKWNTEIPSTDFGNRNWYLSTNNYKGILNYFPTNDELTGVLAGARVQYSLFQPKWQADDYYENNFRLNIGDAVTLYYKDADTAISTTTLFSSAGA